MKDAVAIKSVSAWPDTRPDITTMINWTVDKLKAIGTTIELADVGVQTLPDGRSLALPQVILGILGNVSTRYLDLMDVVVILFSLDKMSVIFNCPFDNNWFIKLICYRQWTNMCVVGFGFYISEMFHLNGFRKKTNLFYGSVRVQSTFYWLIW